MRIFSSMYFWLVWGCLHAWAWRVQHTTSYTLFLVPVAAVLVDLLLAFALAVYALDHVDFAFLFS